MRHVRTLSALILNGAVLCAIALVIVCTPVWPASTALGAAQDAEAKKDKKKEKDKEKDKEKKSDKDGAAAPADREAIGSNLSSEEMRRLLSLHNEIRADVGVAPFTWSPEIAAYAQTWADHIASKGTPEHRPHDGEWKQLYGENIFAGIAGTHGVADAVKLWDSEKKLYAGQVIAVPSPAFLHYTQLVWRATTQIGCGKAERDGNVFIVCNYAPVGNIPGQKPY